MADVPSATEGMAIDVTSGWGAPITFGRKGAEYIPTWQLGQSQDTPSDYEAFARRGYAGSSVVFACIMERATSLADLPITLMRPTANGPETVEHPVTDLLRNPTAEMDGFEFMETLVTHLDVAGNAYIHKRRKSDDPQRRNAYRVKELGLIRPDYVTIVPGRKRAEDVFEVKVAGTVQARLPRADVVHIKTPNPANDFYGLSPLAVIAREVDLDTVMTDFDLSFFKNAGVPMGLLKTKSRHSPDERQQIKSEFRRAFSGIRKWFEILVLNSDEAEYQPLGVAPKEMEQPGMREFAESRVCAVYGVPPIIAGLLVGLIRATYSNYEQAQQSFWSETMSPLAKRISAAFTRELLPEFATAQDRGAYLSFDFSNVKALQEDHTAKLAGVAGLIVTGGFTVNEALAAHRLPTLPSGDFYVRSVAQVTEAPITRGKMLIWDERPKQITEKAPRERLVDRTADDLAKFLEQQANRVVARLPKSIKALDEDDLLPKSEDEALLKVLRPHFLVGLETGWVGASTELGISPAFSLVDPNVIELLQTAGTNITAINDETRSQIAKALEVARGEGLAIREIADMIRNLSGFSPRRAETIARTEMARADNEAAITRYETSGMVDEVDIIDGPECGWSAHDDPDLAHGSRRTLAEFRQQVLSHPNCVRSRSPVIRS